MRKYNLKLKMLCRLTIVLIFMVSSVLLPQAVIDGDPSEIKETILSANQIKSVNFNYGSIGKPNYLGNIADFYWKGLGYIFEFGPIVAAKVISENSDTILITNDSYILPNQGNYSPDGTVKWGWLPRAGYANPNQPNLATAKNPPSWPQGWNSWPGEFGNGVIYADDEAYFCVDDFTNRMANYFPIPSDTSKRGLGLKMEVRIYQFKGMLRDALIIKYFLTNESSKNLKDVHFGFHGDPHIGGPSDYSDDRVGLINSSGYGSFSHARNTIYCWDADMAGGSDRKPAGYLSLKFLETPNSSDLKSFHVAPYTNSLPNVPKNTALMWDWFNSGVDTLNPILSQASDYVVNFSTGPFDIDSGEQKIISIAIFCSENFEDMIKDAVKMHFGYNWPSLGSLVGQSGGNQNYTTTLTSQNSGVVSGIVPVTWNYYGQNPNAKIYIDISSDRGINWKLLTENHPYNEPFLLNTNQLLDGANYILRIVAYDPGNPREYFYDISENKFGINNSQNAKPEIEIITNLKDTIFTTSSPIVRFLLEDVDNNLLDLKISYSLKKFSGFTDIFNGQITSGEFSIPLDLISLPNSDSVFLKIYLSDGNSDSILISPKFSTKFSLINYTTNNFYHPNGRSTAALQLHIVDSVSLLPHTYNLNFTNESSQMYFDISDYNTGQLLVNHFPLVNSLSTTSFHGMKLLIKDTPNNINLDLTHFNDNSLDTTVQFFYPPTVGYITNMNKLDYDWMIIFNDMDTTLDGRYKYPADTARTHLPPMTLITPFRVYSLTHNEKANYIAIKKPYNPNITRWLPSMPIVLQSAGPPSFKVSYEVRFNFDSTNLPGFGDTLFIITDKQITTTDVFRFALDSVQVITNFKLHSIPESYSLSQNFPNPFNPTTKIKYSIPSTPLLKERGRGEVATLKVFDILGREVATLVNEEKQPGEYEVEFPSVETGHAPSLPSGVYFYQLKVGEFIQTRKMIFLK